MVWICESLRLWRSQYRYWRTRLWVASAASSDIIPACRARPAAQRCSPGSKLANNRNFDYSENTFVYYFLKEKCLEHPKALCSAIFLLA